MANCAKRPTQGSTHTHTHTLRPYGCHRRHIKGKNGQIIPANIVSNETFVLMGRNMSSEPIDRYTDTMDFEWNENEPNDYHTLQNCLAGSLVGWLVGWLSHINGS